MSMSKIKSQVDLFKYVNMIHDRSSKELVRKIIDDNLGSLKELPASISGHWHLGETLEEHIDRCCWFAVQIITNMGLSNEDADVLLFATLTHDISKPYNTRKERNPNDFQRLYQDMWNRGQVSEYYHGTLSAWVIGKYALENNVVDNPVVYRASNAVAAHMSHWVSEASQPRTDVEKYLCLCDYFGSRKEIQLNL